MNTTITGNPREAELRAEIQKRANELDAIVEAFERERAKPIVGKCFKYRNRDSDSSSWWLFFRVLSHDHSNRFKTLKFDAQPGGWKIVVVDDGAYIDEVERGYIEISRREFDREYTKFLRTLEQLNAPPRKRR